MKKSLIIVVLLLNFTINAQEDKTVNLTVSGTGKTIEEAKTNALRSAIEQAFGAFISSKTEILNDNLVKDEIVSVANGNIQSFDILKEFQLLDNNWSITLKAVVSVNKLISFVESKGITVEIKGGLFALNIKQQMLNEENEVRSILNLTTILFDFMQNSFDYDLKVGEPKSVVGDNQKWNLPITVNVTANKNNELLNDYCLSTLHNISLNENEINNYLGLNKPIYKISFKNASGISTFSFRNKISLDLLNLLFMQEYYCIENFKIDIGSEKNFEYDVIPSVAKLQDNNVINLSSNQSLIGTFYYKYMITLPEIEKLSNISVVANKKNFQFVVPSLINVKDIKDSDLVSFFVDKTQISDNIENEKNIDNSIYNTAAVEEKPFFPGGDENLQIIVKNNFNLKEEEDLSGKVYVTFVVEKDGLLSDIKVVRDIGYGTGKEIIRILKFCPKWTPGRINGKKNRCLYSFVFKI